MKIFSFLLIATLILTTQISLADTTCVHYPGASELIYIRPTLANQITTTHFKIHWENPTTSTYANNAANYAEYAYQRICVEMGWQVPPNDDGRGGDNKYDIYLVNESYIPKSNGVTQPEIIGNWTYEWSPSFILIRNTIETENQLKMVVAHEFNHASQLAYSCRDGSTDTWFLENTAVWVAEMVYNYAYKYYEHYFEGADPLDHPDYGIHTYWGDGKDWYNYAGFLWPKFLAEWTGDNAIVRKIWLRFGQNPGDNIFTDINYTLSGQEYESSLNEAVTKYAEWRYFTGTRDDGEHFDNADELPTSVIFSTNEEDQINGFGGTVYLQFIPQLGLMEISFDGEDNNLWQASIIQEKFGPPSNTVDLPLDNYSAGSADIETEGCANIVLMPILFSDVTKKSYSYNYMDINAGKVFFSNKKGFTLLDGNLELDINTIIPSGGYRWLRVSSTQHYIKTLNERFQDSPIYKHNNWNGVLNNFYLKNNFTVQSYQAQYKDANFIPLNTATICNVIDGMNFNDGVPICFNDPWFVKDINDNQSGMGDFIYPPSPYLPTGKYNESSGGVFLDQNITSGTFYSIRAPITLDAPLSQTGKTHKFYFQSWGFNGTDPLTQNNIVNGYYESPVVFRSTGATVTANLKGTQLTNTSFTDNKSGQRGFLKDNVNGYLHNVYESMNKIWYERSTDNGDNWTLMNNGLPINPEGTNAKSPSICENKTHDFLYIAYQCDPFPYNGLFVTQFRIATDVVTPDWNQSICNMSDYDYSNDYQSVISSMGDGGVVVCNPPSTSTAGLRAFNFTTDWVNHNFVACSEFSIPSSQNSSNPSLAADCQRYHLVFEEAKLSIKYYAWGGGVTCSSTVSTKSGTTYNLKPVISLLECGNPVISWIGATTGYYPTRLNTRIGTFANNIMTWGSINSVLGLIRSASNASNSISPQRTLITWTDMYGSKWQKRDGTTYSNPASLSHNGSWTQASTNGDFILPKALVFNSTSTPYYFITSTTDFTGGNSSEGGISNNGTGNNYLGKITENDTILTFGRSGVASINDIEFVFEIGDIIVGDSIIKFIQIPDTLAYSSTSELNQHTRTNNFTLNPETNFYFSNIYYVVQKSSPDTALTTTDAVNFKAELVNAITNQVVGTFDNITYNKNNLEKYASIDYEVDCSGITAGEYYLRLVTSVNTDAAYTLANIVSDNTTLAKKNFNKVNFMGSEIPITYELSNNFPNPFNPSTTIRYQIPQDGIVTLKIYDILGSEVATLVNEEKVAGKYEVNFNASSLASGVYIYKIQAGSFINSKKMILLK